ncbi:hypothetical protein OWI80_10915, partial [Mammaliicoccus sciuri]|nr:hypothetical protein [Mammaliicoccus sciuri]
YLLKDHWEKNQNKKFIFKNKDNELKLCVFTLEEFNILNKFVDLGSNCKEEIYIKLNDELDKRLKPYQSSNSTP